MKILFYNQLDTTSLQSRVEKVVGMLEADDFKAAEVKKLVATSYYQAKLDDNHGLLFTIIDYHKQSYMLLLEIVKNDDYDNSRFLKGLNPDIAPISKSEIETAQRQAITYLNPDNRTCYLLNKFISFDDQQYSIFRYPLPLILIGSAGSGKTSLTLEKMKTCTGNILYVTLSPYLVQSARDLYYANGYDNEDQQIDFLSYHEFLETIRIPEGKEVTPYNFLSWFQKQHKPKSINDGRKLFEEFKGVITGSSLDKEFLSQEEYCQLGIKQSIYLPEERLGVYELFEKYSTFIQESRLYDSNILSHRYLSLTAQTYDAVVVDEVQDFTSIQLFLILKTLTKSNQFLLSGDSNQIIHPNFFSWSQLKAKFYQGKFQNTAEITRIITKNYRNTPEVTHMANQVLKIKNVKFGSIDKESHYLVEAQAKHKGNIAFLQDKPDILKELNEKTRLSVKFAIVVLYEWQKEAAKRQFNSPLIFSIQEAKGLEYENVILYQFIGNESKFIEIARGIVPDDLKGDYRYARAKSKLDKSLEVYKFYINALYVGITRAVKNVYIIESSCKHPFLSLLGLNSFADVINLENVKSSQNEWQLEANKLALQGKKAQAQQIQHAILGQKPLPWTPLDRKAFELLQRNALQESGNKKMRLQLYEYALVYQYVDIIQTLKEMKFKPAKQAIKKSLHLIQMKYFMFYSSSNTTAVLREINTYGINFRNLFNLTPLMVSAYLGNATLAKELITLGADKGKRDNLGRTAYQLALYQCCLDKQFAAVKMPMLAAFLIEDSISIQVEQRMIKVDAKTIEFFLINFLMARLRYWVTHRGYFTEFHGFSANDIVENIQYLPAKVIVEKRKRRQYISSVLSRNEIARDYIYNRKIFLRIRRGYYLLDPNIAVKIGDDWQNIYHLMDIDIEKILPTYKACQQPLTNAA